MGFPDMTREDELVDYWRKKLKEGIEPMPPAEVKAAQLWRMF